ncbi:MAG: hypothetical protein ACMUEM_02075 [Flavobacteriales bacterium AspAUS03]
MDENWILFKYGQGLQKKEILIYTSEEQSKTTPIAHFGIMPDAKGYVRL